MENARLFLSMLRKLTVPNVKERIEEARIDKKIAIALGRASASAATRDIDPRRPLTWEFAGFSQHGEDGILDYLCSKIERPNRFFFEIGASAGIENCTAWFAFVRGYAGIMVEGDPIMTGICQRALRRRVQNVHAINMFVNTRTIEDLMKLCPYSDLDLFVIDIDGIDYYVLERVLDLGFRPKIITVEYNSAFGPEKAITIPYRDEFSRHAAHPSALYYGVSVSAWTKLLTRFGYHFVTVESTGVNAFYVSSEAFPSEFLSGIQGVQFLENLGDTNEGTRIRMGSDGKQFLPPRDWRTQFKMIEDMEFVEV